MADVTVKQYADVLGITPDRLLQQLTSAGIKDKSADDILLADEKRELLGFLRQAHGADSNAKTPATARKITLKRRKTTTTLKPQGARSRTATGGSSVNVEVRKKKKLVSAKPTNADTSNLATNKLEQQKALKLKREQEELQRQKLEIERKKIQSSKKVTAEQTKPEKNKKIEDEKKQTADKAKQKLSQEQAATKTKDKPETVKPAPSPADKSAKTLYGRKELHVKQHARRRPSKKHTIQEKKKVETTTEHVFTKPTEPVIHDVAIPESITVGELAQGMSVKAGDLLKVMMNNGIMATINQTIDHDTAYLLVEEMGHNPVEAIEASLEDEILKEAEEDTANMNTRPPVVTIMGHVDHGKTSVLDYIRKSQVTKGEAGGITQHIGAYKVKTEHGDIAFLDTPGHAAFTAMRARGAKVTDIVIIVVAADDSVMPQTIESIEHAKAAEVSIIVAVNKIDVEGADPEKVKTAMANKDVSPEDWGGDVPFVNVSAHTGEGINELLEIISLQAEIMELKAAENVPARGSIIESRIDKGHGAVSTIMIQSGILKKGDVLLAGSEYGRVRRMMNEYGETITQAGPSTPVQVLGLSGCPEAGESAIVVERERIAREIANERKSKHREHKLAQQKQSSLDLMFDKMQEGDLKEVNILVKADVNGSAEAIKESLQNLSNEQVKVKVIATGVGGINESDVNLAIASNAVIVGFNVRADAAAKKLIKSENIQLNYYSIIYDIIDTVKGLIAGSMKPEFKDKIIGIAEVKDVFKSPKLGTIAGCIVTEGTIRLNSPIRVLRDNVVIFEGELESLRRHKDDVKEVKSGTECGIGVKSYNDVKVGDQIEVSERVEVKRTL